MVTIRRPWLPLVAGSVVALCSAGCSGPPSAATPAKAEAESASTPTVAFLHPKKEPLSKEVVLTGEFRAYQVTDLYARISGFLRQIRVDVGNFVRSGDVLATVEVPEMDSDIAQTAAERRRSEAELGRAKADLGRAQANLGLINVSLKRLEAAAKAEPGIIAQQEIDEAQAKKAAAEAQVEAAKAAIGVEESRIGVAKAGEQRSQTMAGYRTIVAPFNGVIVKRYAHPGALSQSAPVLRIAEVNRLRLVAQVPESVVPLARPGDSVEVKVGSLNKKFPAKISRLNLDVASTSRTMEAEIDIPNPSNELAPGMYADVTLLAVKRTEGLTVPVTAVMNGGGNRSVYVVAGNGTVEERQIKTGIEMPASYEVLEGLHAEDRVVVSNRSLLRVGQKVEARPAGDQ
ncbi:MAG TPA: efflux RND transporter periplasmic adaptor subunit [Bryobacteraceae bacterium]|nr:efflux RND transporter periplasmic adaptor subunit [Bryobacteraceae bacterium]